MPSPRYAHLSCLTSETGYDHPPPDDPEQEESSRSHHYIEIPGLTTPPIKILKPNRRRRRNLLTLLGGQDISNRYIGEINVLDLDSMQWVEGRRWERHCGTYRSVACTAQLTVRQGDRLDGSDNPDHDEDSLRRLSWSEKPSVERPEPVYLYSNFNFNERLAKRLEISHRRHGRQSHDHLWHLAQPGKTERSNRLLCHLGSRPLPSQSQARPHQGAPRPTSGYLNLQQYPVRGRQSGLAEDRPRPDHDERQLEPSGRLGKLLGDLGQQGPGYRRRLPSSADQLCRLGLHRSRAVCHLPATLLKPELRPSRIQQGNKPEICPSRAFLAIERPSIRFRDRLCRRNGDPTQQ
ncbi:hypothetical protein PTTG_11841, partial [Puccinia triticina 1-1 BBBD Race 1]